MANAKDYIAPKRLLEALRTQGMSVWGMRDGGKEGIFTTSYLMVGRKPEGWAHPGTEQGLNEMGEGKEDVGNERKDVMTAKQ